MKKVLMLVLVLAIAMTIAMMTVAIAEAVATAPPDSSQVVALEPTAAPMVATATEQAQETDPGGIDLTPLLQALVGVLALVITRYVVPWLKAHIDAVRLARLDYWYRVAVTAAEKAYGSGHGTEKLADATEYLKTKGIVIDDKIVDSLIQELFDGAKRTGATTTT